jgi:hypothetical protein
MWAHTLTSSLQTLCLNLILDANASWGVILNLWILILWSLSLRTFGKLKIVWIIAGFAFWVCGLIQFLWICDSYWSGDKHPRVGIILACMADVYACRGSKGTGDIIITEVSCAVPSSNMTLKHSCLQS